MVLGLNYASESIDSFHRTHIPDEGIIVRLRKPVRQIVKSDRRYLLQLIIVEQRVLDYPVRFAD